MNGDLLRKLRLEKGLTQAELSRIVNVTPKAISFYENNQRDPDNEMLKTFANIFGVSIDYLLDNEVVTHKEFRRINVYGEVPAGIPIEAIEDVQDFEDISFKEFDKNKQYIGLKVKGDSMYPKYLEGDTIIVEVSPECESGEDAVVYVNGYDATLKKVIKNSNGSITLVPLNTNYSPRTYGDNDETITILGIVKQIRRNI